MWRGDRVGLISLHGVWCLLLYASLSYGLEINVKFFGLLGGDRKQRLDHHIKINRWRFP